MVGPFLRALFGSMMKKSAAKAALKTSGRKAAQSTIAKKPNLSALKPDVPAKQVTETVIKPDPKMFQSAPSRGQYPLPPVWFERAKERAATKPETPSIESLSPGRVPKESKPGEAPGKQTVFERVRNSVNQLSNRVNEFVGMSQPGKPEAEAEPLKKTPRDYSRLMGMMGNPNAMRDMDNEAKRKLDQERALVEESKSLEGQFKQLGKSSVEVAKSVFSIIGRVTGLGDAAGAVKKLLSGDVVGAFKDGGKAGLKFSTIMFTLPFVVKRWSDSLVESQRELMMFNGRIAASIAKLDVQRFQLGVRGAAATEASTVRLNKAIGQFREEFQPISQDIKTIVNTLALMLVNMGTMAAKGTKIAGEIARFLPQLGLLKTIVDILEAGNDEEKGSRIGDILDVLERQGNMAQPPNNAPPPPMQPPP